MLRIPVRKIPSNVPAPPMLAIGAPNSGILWRFIKSAPIRAPSVPMEYAKAKNTSGGRVGGRINIVIIAVKRGGTIAGVAIPTPFIGLDTEWINRELITSAIRIVRSIEVPYTSISLYIMYKERETGIMHPPRLTAIMVFASLTSISGTIHGTPINITIRSATMGCSLLIVNTGMLTMLPMIESIKTSSIT